MSRSMRSMLQGVWREFVARRARLALLIPLEAAGVVALFVAAALIDSVLLRPLRFPDPEALVEIWNSEPQQPGSQLFLTAAEIDFYQRNMTSFESSVAFTTGYAFITEGDAPEPSRIVRMRGDLCHVLRMPPIAGRCLTDADSAPGAPAVALIRRARATGRFQDPGRAVGTMIAIDDRAHEIVGVVSDDLQLRAFGGYLYGPPDYAVALGSALDAAPSASPQVLTARLAAGRALPTAASELATLSRAYATHVPNSNDGKVAGLWSLRDETVQSAGPQATAIIAGGILLAVLVIFNSTLLRAAEAGRRRPTYAIKAALGASAARLRSEELAVSVVTTAIIGGVVWPAASTAIASFVRTEPWGLPGLRQETFPAYFASALALVCGAGTVAGLMLIQRNMVPGSEVGLLPSRAIGSAIQARWSRIMVAAQCAMAVMLVGATLLLLKTMWNLAQVDVGVRTDNLLVIEAMLPSRLADTPAKARTALDTLLEAAPVGVAGDVALVNAVPLALRGSEIRRVDVAGLRGTDDSLPMVGYRLVSSDYFDVAGIPVRGGRPPEPQAPDRAPELVVNEAFVQRFLDEREPLGMPLRILPPAGDDAPGQLLGTIVGIVANVRHWGMDKPAPPEIYVPYQVDPPTRFALLFRPKEPQSPAASAIREHLHRVAPELAAFPVSNMKAIVNASLGLRRFATVLFGVFAAVAVLVTALGLYGLTAGYVMARRAEIAVRVSIGAGRENVAALVMQQALVPALFGCVVGTAALMATGRILRSWLFEASPTDPGLVLLLPLFMVTIALVAVVGPLLSALKVMPIELLRGR